MGHIYIDNRGDSAATGGCLPAILSLFVPGLGQLILGRPGIGACHLVVAALMWCFLLGPLVHLYSALNAGGKC